MRANSLKSPSEIWYLTDGALSSACGTAVQLAAAHFGHEGYGKRALISADGLTVRRSGHSWTDGHAGVRAFCMRQGHMHLCWPEWRGSRHTGLWTRRETRALRPATARSH